MWTMFTSSLEALAFGPVAAIGFSFGGMLTQLLALEYPNDVNALVISACPSTLSDEGRKIVAERGALAERDGMAAVLDATMKRWFTESFRLGGGGAPTRERLCVCRHQWVGPGMAGDGGCRHSAAPGLDQSPDVVSRGRGGCLLASRCRGSNRPAYSRGTFRCCAGCASHVVHRAAKGRGRRNHRLSRRATLVLAPLQLFAEHFEIAARRRPDEPQRRLCAADIHLITGLEFVTCLAIECDEDFVAVLDFRPHANG